MREGQGRNSGLGFRAPEVFLAVLVISVVAMMIVPLPTWLLDLLLATNISLSVAILLVVLYVPDALAIATFPTVLLLTTLLRLSLNVSSARLILLQANAGEVIAAFGNFVVKGNYVVGAVIFLVLTIIQFVVIAKGSERVAEVGARFVLDAMPGKQMAIDAELRAGSIDSQEARKRRRMLSRESQFYGAMDGAMKFVKGDVIASLVITVVNILGGLAIGVGQRGMEVTTALKRYGLLTIGDGLVSQIPALILATSAGVLVTRTASEEPGTPLGEDLAKQLFGVPKALRVASVFITLLAIVPGLPTIPFLVLGIGLFVAGTLRSRAMHKEERARLEETSRPTHDVQFVPILATWSLELAPNLADAIDDSIRPSLSLLREQFFRKLGVPLPPARLRIDRALAEGNFRLSLFEIPVATFEGVEVGGDSDPGLAIAQIVFPLLERRAGDLLGLTEVQRLLDELEQLVPALVRNVVPKPLSLVQLTDILRRLVEEAVSVQDLRSILEALSAVASVEKDPLQLAEYLRSQLRRPITHRLTGGEKHLDVVLIDPMIEEEIRRAITRTPSGAFLALSPQASRDVLGALRFALNALPEDAQRAPVLLTQPDIRRFVRKLTEVELPNAFVTSFAELLPEVALRPLARVAPR